MGAPLAALAFPTSLRSLSCWQGSSFCRAGSDPLSPDGWLSESIAYIGMMSILLAFLLETRDVLHSKQPLYLFLMAFGSGLLGVRAFLIDEWAFLVLEVVWCGAAVLALYSLTKSTDTSEDEASS